MISREQTNQVLSWSKVEKCAESAFSRWLGSKHEKAWARRSWRYLEKAGLASYSNAGERCRAAICFIAIADIYYDFLKSAWEEEQETCWSDFAYYLQIGISDIVELARVDTKWFDKEDLVDLFEPDQDDFTQILASLTRNARADVFEALENGYGHIDSLFTSLWKTKPGHHNERNYDILAELTTDKMSAYEWLTARQDVLRW